MNNEYKNRIYQKLKRELGPLVFGTADPSHNECN